MATYLTKYVVCEFKCWMQMYDSAKEAEAVFDHDERLTSLELWSYREKADGTHEAPMKQVLKKRERNRIRRLSLGQTMPSISEVE